MYPDIKKKTYTYTQTSKPAVLYYNLAFLANMKQDQTLTQCSHTRSDYKSKEKRNKTREMSCIRKSEESGYTLLLVF